jgi:hypothetical protein
MDSRPKLWTAVQKIGQTGLGTLTRRGTRQTPYLFIFISDIFKFSLSRRKRELL